MTAVENPSWTTRQLYESLVSLEGARINLREALVNMGSMKLVHVHIPIEKLSANLVSAGLTHHKLSRRLEYERRSYPHSKYEDITPEFDRRRARIDGMVKDAVENEYGTKGSGFLPYSKETQEAVIFFSLDKEFPDPSEIEVLLQFSKIDFMPMFHPPGVKVSGGSDNINATRVDERVPDIYEVHTPVPDTIVDPSLDHKERLRLAPDKWDEFLGITSDDVSEEAPRLVHAMLAARV